MDAGYLAESRAAARLYQLDTPCVSGYWRAANTPSCRPLFAILQIRGRFLLYIIPLYFTNRLISHVCSLVFSS